MIKVLGDTSNRDTMGILRKDRILGKSRSRVMLASVTHGISKGLNLKGPRTNRQEMEYVWTIRVVWVDRILCS